MADVPSESFPVNGVLDSVLDKLRTLAETGQTFGEPITVGDTTIVPYMSWRFGLGGGGGGSGQGGSSDKGRGLTNHREQERSLWGGAGGGVKVEPMGFLVIRAGAVELLPIDRPTNQWAQLAEGLVPMVEQWIKQQSQAQEPTEDWNSPEELDEYQ